MRVSCAEEGSLALQCVAEAAAGGDPFELAVLDMHMPRMDGLELARILHAAPASAATKLIMLSSTYALADQSQRIESGILRYLNKPVRRADLFRAVTGILSAVPPDSTAHHRRLRLETLPQGRRVLLVEDNAINQEVASAMLRRLGLGVTLATNGADAVALAQTHEFDLVLMDCQMPVFDGLEATRRIRVWEGTEGRPALPIIALTANATAEDRAACAAAGMNDYLAKPVTGRRLAEMLAHYLQLPRPTPTRAAVAHPSATARHPRLALFDPTVLAALPMVADGSEPEFAQFVLEQFQQGSAESLQRIRQAVDSGDQAEALRVLHTLNSTSAQVGVLALASCAGALEARMRGGQMLDAPDVAELGKVHQRALQAIAAHAAPGARPAQGQHMNTHPAAPHLLIVDDDMLLRSMAVKTLRHAGFEVSEVADGEAALLRFQDHAFDLILLDVMLPGLDGYEVCRRIRSMAGGARVPILMLTAATIRLRSNWPTDTVRPISSPSRSTGHCSRTRCATRCAPVPRSRASCAAARVWRERRTSPAWAIGPCRRTAAWNARPNCCACSTPRMMRRPAIPRQPSSRASLQPTGSA